MAKNTKPVFPKDGILGWQKMTAANTNRDGTGTVGTDIFLLATAGADGLRIDKVRLRSMGACVASVFRLFINNGSTNATVANNTLVDEVSLPLTSLTQVAAQTPIDIIEDIMLPATYRLYGTLATAVADGWAVTAEAGNMTA